MTSPVGRARADAEVARREDLVQAAGLGLPCGGQGKPGFARGTVPLSASRTCTSNLFSLKIVSLYFQNVFSYVWNSRE